MDSTWLIDPEVLLALRLDRIEQSIFAEHAEQALLEAEELLDEHPTHPLGLFYAGRAALLLGAAHTARAALEKCCTLQPADATLLASLAAARFESGDLDAALEAAEAALESAEDIPSAWYTRGVILERRDAPEAAAACFARAELLDPSGHPAPLSITEARWERALTKAQSVLPTAIQAFYVQVPTRWLDYPDPTELTASYPTISPWPAPCTRAHRRPMPTPGRSCLPPSGCSAATSSTTSPPAAASSSASPRRC
ncbi:MAG: tetratricopeptide (TPR) repeat protein [Myxococcota bacterium]|jgi:tetratricopeptide (TPR) repeat protein